MIPVENLQKQLPVEKLFVHLDKPNYTLGDTIWFKAYLLDGSFLTPAIRSGLLYVELDDADNNCVKRIMTPVLSGLSWGCLALNPDEIPDGSYTLRAYTNWMRNFGEEAVFKQNLFVLADRGDPLLVSIRNQQPQPSSRKDSITTDLHFTGIDGKSVRLQDMQLKVLDGKRLLYRYKAATSLDGAISLSYSLPAKTDTRKLMIQVREMNKKEQARQLLVPVALNRPERIDLQFMPEGGNLVAGIPVLTGFKAIGEDGKSVEVAGKIYNNTGELISGFRSVHKGMGAFRFTPKAGETYTAVVDLPDGGKQNYHLPEVKVSGTGLQVRAGNNDSLDVTISATADIITSNRSFYLIGQSRNTICYGALILFKEATVRKRIARSVFFSGVARFTLLSEDKRPLNERMVYINHSDQLQLDIKSDRSVYAPHDSVALNLRLTRGDGQPVRGYFSLAVTDDNQVKCDPMADNLRSNMLLSSFLKGTVEEPGYYFDHPDAETTEALDNLLLTQGWVGYSWDQVYASVKPPLFAAEPEFVIHGRVTNIFNKPVSKLQVLLFSKKPKLLLDAVTGENGDFTFKGFAPVDTASFVIQALNKEGKNANVGIEVDNFTPPVFMHTASLLQPWYVNTDTAAMQNVQAKQSIDQKLEGSNKVLREVNITAKKTVKDSKSLNGPGEADQVLNERDMEQAGKKTLGDLLEEKINGFKVMGLWHPCISCSSVSDYYLIYDKKVHFVFDGILLDYVPETPYDRYIFLKPYLDYYTAEDITGIEVMYGSGYSAKYDINYLYRDPDGKSHDNSGLDHKPIAYIEITTRAGKGPSMNRTPGLYVDKPMSFSTPKRFYRPRYTVKDEPDGRDRRSTIHWEPNIFIDTTGRAVVSFYNADKPGRYTIIVQGTDLNGSLGYGRSSIIVK